MSIRFPSSTRKTIVVESRHDDASGGGRYTLQLVKCLQSCGEVFICGDTANNEALTGIQGLHTKTYRKDFQPDLYVAISHWGGMAPIGKSNAHAIFFPLEQNSTPAQYDYLICLNEYVRLHSLLRFAEHKGRAFVIAPAIDLEQYSTAHPKENLLLNVGNYFCEADGHSKNQHILLDWFEQNELCKEYELVLAGFEVHAEYYSQLQSRAARIPNVRVLSGIKRAELLDLFMRASFLIHANGYGRKNYHQTEHFGYVAIEAMACGCQPIVHNSGGCRDLPGVRVWNHPDDIRHLMYPVDKTHLRASAESFSFDRMREQTGEFWREVCLRLDG